jgi:oxygen-independent coproporphyrinogen-3 oxidase
MLSAAGYDRYEISNYAKPGRACRHNLKYWRRLSYLGIGLGASSFLDHMRFSNEPDEREYRERVMTGKYMPDECERLSVADEKAEFMFLGLRCMQGVSAKDFSDCFGEEMLTYFGEPIRRCIGQGLLEREGDRVRLTKRGIDVSNRVFCEFLE